MNAEALRAALTRRMEKEERTQKAWTLTQCRNVRCVLCREVIGQELRMLMVNPNEYWAQTGETYTPPQFEPVHRTCLLGRTEEEAVQAFWSYRQDCPYFCAPDCDWCRVLGPCCA